MATFKMLVGLPASGKSTYAKAMDGIIISSDDIRRELYGDESIQGNPGKIFEEVFRRAKIELEHGNDVIIDATNINAKKRTNTLKQFNKYNKECHYFATSFEQCAYNNAWRKKSVPHDVIMRMHTGLHVPSYREGWDEITIIPYEADGVYWRSDIENLMLTKPDHDNLFKVLSRYFNEFKHIHNLPHDSKWHTLSVSRHTYYVYDYIYNNYSSEDRLIMLWAALLHDIGKGVTKTFKPGERYAHYYSHENCGAQIAAVILKQLGYSDGFTLEVSDLVQLHMRMHQSEQHEFLKNLVGDKLFNKLSILHDADVSAH